MGLGFRWTLHPVIATTRDNGNYMRVLLYSYYTTTSVPIIPLLHAGGPPNFWIQVWGFGVGGDSGL